MCLRLRGSADVRVSFLLPGVRPVLLAVGSVRGLPITAYSALLLPSECIDSIIALVRVSAYAQMATSRTP